MAVSPTAGPAAADSPDGGGCGLVGAVPGQHRCVGEACLWAGEVPRPDEGSVRSHARLGTAGRRKDGVHAHSLKKQGTAAERQQKIKERQ